MIPVLDERNRRIIEFIKPRKKDKILVIGTGVFPKTEFFLFHHFSCRNIISGDINERNIFNGKRILPELNFIKLDAQKKFPFSSKSFDKIIFTEVLEHLKNEEFALKEIKRVLKKSGLLVLSVPKKRWFNIFNPVSWLQHEREYDEARISRILNRNGFKINKMLIGGDFWELANLWIHLFLKYFFRKLYINSFFPDNINKSWKKNFKGKGVDIIVQAGKNLS